MGNSAVRINGFTNTVTTNNHITDRGSDWYFTVCAVMGACTLGLMALSFFKTRSQRLFYYITAAVTLIASISYFCMGSNLGWTAIQVEFERSSPKEHGNMRQIFYVRYIDFFITTPLLLADLLLVCGLPTPTILYVMLIQEIMVIMGLVGALVKSTYKWGFFTFGVAAFFFVAYTIVWEGRQYARVLGADITRTYTILSLYFTTMWLLYPIAWGVSEGGNVIPPDSEAVFYGVLDIMTKPVFGALLLWSIRNIELERFGIHIRDATTTPEALSEKQPVAAGTNGVTNGTGETPAAVPEPTTV